MIHIYSLLFSIVIFTIHPILLPKSYMLYDFICVTSLSGCFFPQKEYTSKAISCQGEEIMLLMFGSKKLCK